MNNRDPNRIKELLPLLEKYWIQYPHLRLGQLLYSLIDKKQDVFYVEDTQLIETLKNLINSK